MIKVAPSILSADFANMGADVERLERNGADWIHCDVMDGVFVPNITFGMPMVKAIRKHTGLPLDAHLMIVEPEKYAAQFAKAGADLVSFHPEASKDPMKTIEMIHAEGKKAGVVVNPEIPLSAVEKYLPHVELLLLMSVHPGFGGQSFIESVLPKINEAKAMIEKTGKNIELEIDGGVTVENAKELTGRGVTVLVAGSTVFKAADMKATISELKK